MTLAKRAMLYLTRKKGRSMLLILLIFVMSSFILIGVALLTSANKEIKKIKNNLGSSFVLTEPSDKSENFAGSLIRGGKDMVYIGPDITQDMIDTIMNIDGITEYFPTAAWYIWTELDLIPAERAKETAEEEGITEEEMELLRHQTTALYCTKGDLYKDFRSGAIEIAQGRNIQEGDLYKAVISEQLAEKNGLSVGDTFDISMLAYYEDVPPTLCGDFIEMEIVGIFHINFELDHRNHYEIDYEDNYIFTDIDTGTQLMKTLSDFRGVDSYQDEIYEYTFFVDEPENIEQIMKEVQDSVELEDEKDIITMTRDTTSYAAAVRPLKQISFFALLLLAVGIFGCAVILFLVLSMWVRTRKHEIGILLSMGISKGKIAAQMVLEYITLTVIGLILTTLLSGILVNGCCKAAEYLTKPDSDEPTYRVEMGANALFVPPITKTSADPVHLDYDDSARDMALLVLAVCAISSGSVLVASHQVLRMKPRELLQTM